MIDAEGNSVPFLKGLEEAEPARGWVTRLRPGWVKDRVLEERSRFRKYREGDRVRDGFMEFVDSTVPDGMFRMRVVEVERRPSGSLVSLGASTLLDQEEWGAADVADLYFARWPAQEANFRAVNQALGTKDVHGYGKRLVDNVTVLTRLDKLDGMMRGGEERRGKQAREVCAAWTRMSDAKAALGRRQRRQETVASKLQELVVPGATVTRKTQALLEEQQSLAAEMAKHQREVAKKEGKHAEAAARLRRTCDKLDAWDQERVRLNDNRRIFAHDVELDSLFALLKVGLVLLVTWVLKELLGDARMEASTFLDRVATLPARLQMTPQLQIVTFDYNRRDPEVMGLLQQHCEAINARKLKLRDGRVLRLAIDKAPKSKRPPPPGSRVGSGDRFKR